jgi:hypothetical protein
MPDLIAEGQICFSDLREADRTSSKAVTKKCSFLFRL